MPFEWGGVLVVALNELIDLRDQVLDAGERTAPDGPLCDQGKPSLHLVQPRGVIGYEVQVETLVPCKPAFDGGVFMAAIVVSNQMNLQFVGNVALDQSQKAEELLVAVMGPALRQDLPVCNIQRREQRRGPMAGIVVREALHISQPQG